jgi:hypothetical protein
MTLGPTLGCRVRGARAASLRCGYLMPRAMLLTGSHSYRSSVAKGRAGVEFSTT